MQDPIGIPHCIVSLCFLKCCLPFLMLSNTLAVDRLETPNQGINERNLAYTLRYDWLSNRYELWMKAAGYFLLCTVVRITLMEMIFLVEWLLVTFFPTSVHAPTLRKKITKWVQKKSVLHNCIEEYFQFNPRISKYLEKWILDKIAYNFC